MNKSKFLRIVIGALAVVVAAFIFLNRSSEPEIPTAPEEVVENILKESAPESTRPAKLSTLDFELIEIPDDAAPEVSEKDGVEELQPKKAAGVKVSGDQVLVVINGQPLTANRLMLPSSFKNGKSLSMPAATLQEVLERSVSRELLLLEAGVQGVELGDRQVTQLEETYRHLTGNPLVLPEGQDVLNLGVTDDAMSTASKASA